MVWRLLEFALPYSDDLIATGRHVSILGAVKGYASTLPFIRYGESDRVAMPVITIKLDDDIERRYEGVNTKLVTDKILAFIRHTDLIKQSISCTLQIVRSHGKLLGIHLAQKVGAFWVGIAAGNRAILDVVGLGAGRRPLELLATDDARICILVAALPFICMLNAAKVVISGLESIRWQIERLATQLTHNFMARLSLWTRCLAVAGKGTISLVGTQPLCDNLAASLADDCSDGVGVHGFIITHIGNTVKPMEVMR